MASITFITGPVWKQPFNGEQISHEISAFDDGSTPKTCRKRIENIPSTSSHLSAAIVPQRCRSIRMFHGTNQGVACQLPVVQIFRGVFDAARVQASLIIPVYWHTGMTY